MGAKDIYHDVVRQALKNGGWTITHNPLQLTYGRAALETDLGAERLIAAQRDEEKTAIEIKSFTEPSKVYALHQALGQFIIYQMALPHNAEVRDLYLAITTDVYSTFF